MTKRIPMQLFWATVFFSLWMLTGCLSEEEAAQNTDEAAQALTTMQTCVGDNDAATSTCFTSFASYDMTKDTDTTADKSKKYYNNSARISSGWFPSATYNFKTSSLGEVWFSAWIPAKNAETYAKYTVACKNPTGSYTSQKTFSVAQGIYFGKWVTAGNMGYWESGSTCSVKVEKDGWGVAPFAADSIKMTVYK